MAEAGAEVVKLERGDGEDMRRMGLATSERSIGYAMLNGGKESVPIDLKSECTLATLRPLIERADVLVEQFGRA